LPCVPDHKQETSKQQNKNPKLNTLEQVNGIMDKVLLNLTNLGFEPQMPLA
jgi:hypothetical protein